MNRHALWALGLMAALGLAACEKPDPLAAARTRCADTHLAPNQQIAACAQVIDAGALEPADHAALLANRGFAHRAAGEPTAALRDFTAALALNGQDLHAKLGRAGILADSGQLDAAQPLIDAVIESGQFAAEAHYVRGNINARHGDSANAMQDFDTAIAADPRMADAFAYRARLKQDASDLDGALADYNAALGIEDHHAKARAGRCWVRVLQIGDADDADIGPARADAEAAIAADARNLQSQLCLGVIQLRNGEWGAAHATYDAALAISPASAAALYGRGLAERGEGDNHAGGRDIDHAYQFNSRIDRDFVELGVRR